jgi:membrane protein DedA with SNARE-associated domain
MPLMTPEGTSALLGTWGYPAYLALFLLTALGSPITEDLLLLVGGYLIGAQVFTATPTFVTAYLGLLGADLTVYMYGRKLRSHKLRRRFIRHVIRPGRLRLAGRWFARFGDWIVVLARFVPGTRMLVFASAGLRGMSLARFLAFDAVAGFVWVVLMLVVGERVGERIGNLEHAFRLVGDYVFWILLAVVAGVWFRHWRLREERKLTGPPDAEPE